ncbi:hypothetical protein HGM15179_007901 [Zosterops borbonicus]|uniref:Reverse transcriptase n=1 Tax=Zosterops borbonicus TaxID=364589 RepID=A0A8K1GJB0_9PASS|nr:hypothetical protein HGM15179_007901 [Zosterops borbonicus]
MVTYHCHICTFNLTVPRKGTECLILEAISIHMDDKEVFRSIQHGFTKSKSCLTNLFGFYDVTATWMEDGRAVDIVYLDFFKSFNPVSHYILIGKLRNWGLWEWMMRLIENWLNGRSQKVFIDGTGSSWSSFTSEVSKVQYWPQYLTYSSMTWMKGQMPPSKFQAVHEPAMPLWLRRSMVSWGALGRASCLKKVILLLYFTLVRHSAVSFWTQCKRDMELLEWIQ